MKIEIIENKISSDRLMEMASEGFGEMIKGVADVKKKIIALGGELHADAEAILLENNSKQQDLWGFNIYPDKPREERIEYISFINIRPSQNNRSLEIRDAQIRESIKQIIDSLVE